MCNPDAYELKPGKIVFEDQLNHRFNNNGHLRPWAIYGSIDLQRSKNNSFLWQF